MELKADKTFVFGEECEAYKKSEADKVIAEKDAEIVELKAKNERMTEFKDKYSRCAEKAIDTIARLELKIRRLSRALYKACANWADVEVFERTVGIDDPNIEANRWALMRNKCLKKAEEYK